MRAHWQIRRLICLFLLVVASFPAIGSECGNEVLEEGEDVDPPISASVAVPVDPNTCKYDFSEINQISCNGSCGSWGGGAGCQQPDADALCKLRTGDSGARAKAPPAFVTEARPLPGVCCPPPQAPPGSLDCVPLGDFGNRGVAKHVSVADFDLAATHGTGSVVFIPLDGCELSEPVPPSCIGSEAELYSALHRTKTISGAHDLRLKAGTFNVGNPILVKDAAATSVTVSGGWNEGCAEKLRGAHRTVLQGGSSGEGQANELTLALIYDRASELRLEDLTFEQFGQGVVLSSGSLAADPGSTELHIRRVLVEGTVQRDALLLEPYGNIDLSNLAVRAHAGGCALSAGSFLGATISISSVTAINSSEIGFGALCFNGSIEGAADIEQSLRDSIAQSESPGADIFVGNSEILAVGNVFRRVDGPTSPDSSENISERVTFEDVSPIAGSVSQDSAIGLTPDEEDLFGNARTQGRARDRGAVERQNQAPVAIGPLSLEAVAETQFIFDAREAFEDADGDPLEISAANLPVFLELQDGVLRGRPEIEDIGEFGFSVRGTDPRGLSASLEVQLRVSDLNRAPISLPVPPQLLSVGSPFHLDLAQFFRDPEGAPVRVSLDAVPAGMTVQNSTLAGIPTVTMPQTEVGMIATDAGGLTSTSRLTIEIRQRNQPPIFVEMPRLVVLEGTFVELSLNTLFRDPDGDPLTFAVLAPPDGVSVEGAVLRVAPTQLGTFAIVVVASDGQHEGAGTIHVDVLEPDLHEDGFEDPNPR